MFMMYLGTEGHIPRSNRSLVIPPNQTIHVDLRGRHVVLLHPTEMCTVISEFVHPLD